MITKCPECKGKLAAPDETPNELHCMVCGYTHLLEWDKKELDD